MVITSAGRAALAALLLLFALACTGCFALRYADYALPAARLDGTNNRPLPPRDDPAVQAAFDAWRAPDTAASGHRPTPYHHYVDTPAPGSFEGQAPIGLAFSGGGMRGTLFAAACLRELEALGPIHIDTPDGPRRIDLLNEIDYVTGVSTGAIPAALFVLDTAGRAPDALQRQHWPEALNRDPLRRSLSSLLLRPDRLLLDMTFEVNTRPAFAATLAETYFDGTRFQRDSGLRFADLPATPVLILGTTLLDGRGSAFVQTRLPYRDFLDQHNPVPWLNDTQSFESFATDPMPYTLAEAAYNSMAYPGYVRSGLLKVQPDRDWPLAGLPPHQRSAMQRARRDTGHQHTYGLVDGGLADNRGLDHLAALFITLAQQRDEITQPLIIGLDAGMTDLARVQPGRKLLRPSWQHEVAAATGATWSMGQRTMNAWIEAQAGQGTFDLVLFRYPAWHPHLPAAESEPAPRSAEAKKLAALCRDEPLIGDPHTLLATINTIGTPFVRLDEQQLAAIRITARFAVWSSRDDLLSWAEAAYNGPATFQTPADKQPSFSGEGDL